MSSASSSRLARGLVVSVALSGVACGTRVPEPQQTLKVTAASQAKAAPTMPKGMLAFFTDGTGKEVCPSGWEQPERAAGRLLVGTTTPHGVGGMVERPLENLEDRQHSHPYTASFDIEGTGIAAAASCCTPGAKPGTETSTGETNQGPSNLPFVQLLLCEKL